MRNFVFKIWMITMVSNNVSFAQAPTLDQSINETFSLMDLLGIDTTASLIYSFYYPNIPTQSTVSRFNDTLVQMGYRNVRTQISSLEYSNVAVELIIEEQRVHSSKSLLSKLLELNALATKCGIDVNDNHIKWTAHAADNSKNFFDNTNFKNHLNKLNEIETEYILKTLNT